MITILGKLADTAPYRDQPGYNVWPKDDAWAPERARAWIARAVARGDKFLLVSMDFSGAYLWEIRALQAEAQKTRMRAEVLKTRARELSDAVAEVSKRVLAGMGPVLPID